ncbi:TnsA endonuclease N-terminal domain-containing protein [Amantichitinum ursilacus]|uniref:TnsA endonuclease N-terminal domain-containing protein n=1 Tax=Amantichitinum ursilacus TaxID=857265 RepID=A0A0N0GNB1_9NEIS|nr:TnsA endonuclease N-terminal domain-containing protein [Amantichitinum ursilacus]KPC52280.1 hypothetical protein WG78_14515 [Amantichitinum ursilacus]
MLIPSVRRIHNRNSRKVIGHSYSYKMEGLLTWESTLERDWLLRLEVDSRVRAITAQPRKFDIWHDDKRRLYTPDVLVEWVDPSRRPTLQEVKPDRVALEPGWQEYFGSIRETVDKDGWDFDVITESQIRQEPHLWNAKALRMYAGVQVSLKQRISAQGLARNGCSISGLAARCPHLSPETIYRLILDGALRFLHHERLSSGTVVWTPEEASR